ncbi:MAG: hypothetical protein ACRDY2_00730 [Acidimicrobiales bacterium]
MPVVSPTVDRPVSDPSHAGTLAAAVPWGCLRTAILMILAEGPAGPRQLRASLAQAGCEDLGTADIDDPLSSMTAEGLITSATGTPGARGEPASARYYVTPAGLEALRAGLACVRHRHQLLTSMLAHYQRLAGASGPRDRGSPAHECRLGQEDELRIRAISAP